ncbi:MAG: tetratricopeptide repeat protein [Sphingobacteriaceae bacterium]|nr:tetratricopeptide repeat protein [Sphingobacteriaceae bacterium]
MIKKVLVSGLLIVAYNLSLAQNMNIQNMINYTRNKDYAKAKTAADAAAIHNDTKESAKMWLNRGKVYQAIYSDTSSAVRALDNLSEENALEAYIKCLTLDKGKDIYKDEAKGLLVQSAAATYNKANYYRSNKEFDKAIKCYDMLEEALPFDFDQGIKRANITKEKLVFYRFDTYKYAGDKEKTKNYANKLIESKYRDPKIYTDMVKISLIDKDTAAALDYIEKGKILFDDNMDLINTELNIFLARKKTDELKVKLEKALEVAPDNEVLHNALGNLYFKTKDLIKAEEEYKKAIELKADYSDAYYNLAVLYYNEGKEWNDKLNDAAPKDPKIKEYETKFAEAWKKAGANFESYYDINKDASTKKLLLQIYARLGDNEKAAKFK